MVSKDIYVLGINLSHDGSACILKNGTVICAVLEERLNRIKHSRGYEQSVKYCLLAAGIDIDDVSVVALSENDTDNRLISQRYQCFFVFGRKFLYGVDLFVYNHHLSHAASAFFSSGFLNALVVVIDGSGSGENGCAAESYYLGNENNLFHIESHYLSKDFKYRGVGLTYASFTHHLGYDIDGFDAGIVMGLSSYGNSNCFDFSIYKLIDGNIFANPRIVNPYFPLRMKFNEDTSICPTKICLLGDRREPSDIITDFHKNIAAKLQNDTQDIIVQKLNLLLENNPVDCMAYAGGVALNGLVNADILKRTRVRHLFIPSAASDGGTSLGAALNYWCTTYNKRDFVQTHDYFGKEYFDDEILSALNSFSNIKFVKYDFLELCDLVATKLCKGNVIGWFQGRSEFGPRALGNRSIIADPRNPHMKDILNSKVKHRDSFRPFAPSVLIEHVGDYFESSFPDSFMLFMRAVHDDKKDKIPAVVHVDGTARVQTVTKEQNFRFYSLISSFLKITDIPMLLNTSFNVKGEPIVETPLDAINCFLKTGIDFLVIGDYFVTK